MQGINVDMMKFMDYDSQAVSSDLERSKELVIRDFEDLEITLDATIRNMKGASKPEILIVIHFTNPSEKSNQPKSDPKIGKYFSTLFNDIGFKIFERHRTGIQ